MSVKKRLDKDLTLKRQYADFMHEYEGVWSKSIRNNMKIGLKHFICLIIACESSTTKLRIVFDGSAQSSTGVSVNRQPNTNVWSYGAERFGVHSLEVPNVHVCNQRGYSEKVPTGADR